MDSRFRGNDVIRVRYVTLTTTVIPAMVVIPAEAGIHYGQRIPKLELHDGSECFEIAGAAGAA